MNNRRLYRFSDEAMIAGVAAGLAAYLDVEPALVRILWLISVPLTGGLTLIVYLAMLVLLPVAPERWSSWRMAGSAAGFAGAGRAAFSQSGDPNAAGSAPGGWGQTPGSGGIDGGSSGAGGNGGTGSQPSPEAGPSQAGTPSTPGTGETTQSWTPGPGAPDAAPWGAAQTGGTPNAAPGWGTQPGTPPNAAPGWGTQPGTPPNAAPGWGAQPGGFVPGQPPSWRDARWQRRQERWQRRQDRWEARRDRWDRGDFGGSGGVIFGLVLVLAGAVLLLNRFEPSFDLAVALPTISVGFGIILIVFALLRGIGRR